MEWPTLPFSSWARRQRRHEQVVQRMLLDAWSSSQLVRTSVREDSGGTLEPEEAATEAAGLQFSCRRDALHTAETTPTLSSSFCWLSYHNNNNINTQHHHCYHRALTTNHGATCYSSCSRRTMPVACPAEPSSNSTTVSTSKSPAPQNSCIILLLFVLILPMTMGGYRNSSSPLQLLNPWLSACDLVDPSTAADLRGVCWATSTMVLLSAPTTDNNPDSNNNKENVNNNVNINNNKPNNVHQNCRVNGDISEGPGPPSMCPCACENSSPQHSTTTTPHQNTNQCLDYLNESHKKSVCGSSLQESERESALNKLQLQHCCEHSVLTSLNATARENLVSGKDRHTCEVYIDALLELDALAESITCKFAEVLLRYDCSQTYSVNFHCADCKVSSPEHSYSWLRKSYVTHATVNLRETPSFSLQSVLR